MRTFPTTQFIEILDSLSQIQYVRKEIMGEIKALVYQGVSGNAVIIDVSEEDITELTIKGHLGQLGLPELIGSFFSATV